MKKHEFYVRFGTTQMNCETVNISALTYFEAIILATAERMKKGLLTTIYYVEDDSGGYLDSVKIDIHWQVKTL